MGKLIRDTSTPERREWWKSVLAAADRARKIDGPAEDTRKSEQPPKPQNSEPT